MDSPASDLASSLVPEKTVNAFLDDLRALVNINSGTYTPDGVAQVATYLRALFEATGWEGERRYGEIGAPRLLSRSALRSAPVHNDSCACSVGARTME